MATTTTPIGFTAETSTDSATSKPGFFARFFEKLVEARIRRADLEVRPYLTRLSDESLKDLGFTGPDIEKLREQHYVQAVYWS